MSATAKIPPAFPKLIEGAKVKKVGGDYTFEGVIVSRFRKLGPDGLQDGHIRFVVQDDRGILHIFSGKNLELIKPK